MAIYCVFCRNLRVFFGVNFILQKFCLCKKNDKYQVCKISTEHQILMSTDCQDDMLSENITKDTMSSLQSPLSKKPKLHSFPTAFNHFFLKMSRKYVSEVNEKYALNQWEPFSYGCIVIISFHFLLQSSEFYWPFGLVFWERKFISFWMELLVSL